MSTKRTAGADDDAQRKLAKNDDSGVDRREKCGRCGDYRFVMLTTCYCKEARFCRECQDGGVPVCGSCEKPACAQCSDTGVDCAACDADNAWVCRDCAKFCVECQKPHCGTHMEVPCCVCGGLVCSTCAKDKYCERCDVCEGVRCSDCKSSCAQCGTPVCQASTDDYIPQFCEACQKPICDACFSVDAFTCSFHQANICHACTQVCTVCDEFSCRNSVFECCTCNATICLECADEDAKCRLCRKGQCSDCAIKHLVCRFCTKPACVDCTLQCGACGTQTCAECCYNCELCKKPVCMECDCECMECSLKAYERSRCQNCCDKANNRTDPK